MKRSINLYRLGWLFAVFIALAVNFILALNNLGSEQQHFQIIEHTVSVIGKIDDASEAVQTGKRPEAGQALSEALSLTADNPQQQGTLSEAMKAWDRLPAGLDHFKSLLWAARHRERELLAERIGLRNAASASGRHGILISALLTLLLFAAAAATIWRQSSRSEAAESAMAELQARMELFINHSPLRAYIKDYDGHMLWYSKRYEDVYPGVKNWIGQFYLEGIAREVCESQHESDLEVLKSGQPMTQYLVLPYLGVPRNVVLVKFPLPMSGKTLLGGFTIDITEKVEADQKLERYARQLEESNRELQNFASVAAHDLQEPMRKIQAFGSMLDESLQGDARPEVRENLGRVLGAAKRMRSLIEDLLAYTRVPLRDIPFARLDLDAVASQVLVDLELAIKDSQASIRIDPLPVIQADPTQMRQLFQNLLSNAIKYRRPGLAPQIQVLATQRDGNLELCFQDNGIGFEPQYAERIFELFQRLHGRHEYEGTGIGLSICRKIVAAHGGSIHAEGRPGQGSAFTVTLPVDQAQPKATP